MTGTINENKLAFSIEEVAELTSLSKPFLRLEVTRGKLKIKRFGRRVLVLYADLQNYLSNGSDAQENNADFDQRGEHYV